jgi:uncharacterized protein YbjT (DUF2867 family)
MVNDKTKLVTVFGGSGFIGRHVVRALVKQGHRVRVAVRRPDLAGHLQTIGVAGQIQAMQANVRYPDSIASVIEGADAVVNLVGILYESGRQTFDGIHVNGARTIAQQARIAGLDQIVHLSAISSDPESSSLYARSKSAGENAISEILPKSIIMRPSIVFGPEDNFFNMFANLARYSPVLPLIGGGETRFQPIFVDDVARAIALAVGGQARAGAIYELGGPEVLSFKQLMEYILAVIERKRTLVPVSFALAKIKARFLQLMPKPLLTVDQVRLLEYDNVVGTSAKTRKLTLEGLGIQPHSIEAIVPAYLGMFRPTGQYAGYQADN